jgi:molybdenum-dependent DNA-binding transcriptional regulator ModE
MHGRHTALQITLTIAERHILQHWLRQTLIPAGLHRRAELIWVVAHGGSISAAARRVGMSRKHCYKWLWRWEARRLDGLLENRPQGRPRKGAQG